MTTPILTLPDPKLQLVVEVDASDVGLGGVETLAGGDRASVSGLDGP